MNDPSISVADSIPYATPPAKPRARTAPAVWICLFGLALIVLGGCFCMGIMETLDPHIVFNGAPPPPPTMTPGLITFLVVLYGAVFGCFGGAVLLLQKGIRLLIGLM